ncbi:uncharacterized protein LOC106457818 [Limulus polyphemus]|uniref:Uncharacterized protein LOC106457818 n=1 Tax=Limulus polyphemus TaxID=6850 RepID=A0ABM1B197_LIMPO|nr:uncharacterized protein LOC106457818 [Limulus polyphemus]
MPKKRGKYQKQSNSAQNDKFMYNPKEEIETTKEKNVTNSSLETSVCTNEEKTEPMERTDLTETGRTKYSRRKITSNWNRYEKSTCDNEIEETYQQKGEDFEVILGFSGDSSSQLRLQDEKEWDEDVNEQPDLDLLNIHCDILASTLKCIPLHKRLGLSEESLTLELISRFQQVADCNKSSRKENPKNAHKSRLATKINRDEINKNFSKKLKEPVNNASNSSTGKSEADVSEQKNSKFKNMDATENLSLSKNVKSERHLLQSLSALSLDTAETSNSAKAVPARTELNISKTKDKERSSLTTAKDDDDDLEFLLSLSTPSNSSIFSVNNSKKTSPNIASSSFSVLRIGNEESARTKNTGIPEPSKTSIEDWLDSVLED